MLDTKGLSSFSKKPQKPIKTCDHPLCYVNVPYTSEYMKYHIFEQYITAMINHVFIMFRMLEYKKSNLVLCFS